MRRGSAGDCRPLSTQEPRKETIGQDRLLSQFVNPGSPPVADQAVHRPDPLPDARQRRDEGLAGPVMFAMSCSPNSAAETEVHATSPGYDPIGNPRTPALDQEWEYPRFDRLTEFIRGRQGHPRSRTSVPSIESSGSRHSRVLRLCICTTGANFSGSARRRTSNPFRSEEECKRCRVGSTRMDLRYPHATDCPMAGGRRSAGVADHRRRTRVLVDA